MEFLNSLDDSLFARLRCHSALLFENKWRHFAPRSSVDGTTLSIYFAPFVVASYRWWEQDLITLPLVLETYE